MKNSDVCLRKANKCTTLIGRAQKLLVAIALLISSSFFAQVCGTQSPAGPPPGAPPQSPPPNCNQLLDDLIPKSFDRVIEVRVKFHVFKAFAGSGGSQWSMGANATTAADAQTCLNQANAMLANMPAPALVAGGVTSITNAKIRFVLAGFTNWLDPTWCNNLNNAATTPNTYCDPTCINVYMGNFDAGFNSIYAPTVPGFYPSNWTVFHPQFNTHGNSNWDNINWYGGIFLHEACHILGLSHTTTGELSTASPNYGCCNYIEVQDYVKDDGSWNPCAGTPGFPWANGSNNVMSQNTACGNVYLSPKQCALMHYYLRTNFVNMLSPTGYSDATTRDQNFDYTLTQHETWLNDRYFKGNIIVPNGKTLTVKCGLAMTNGGRIIVQKGGQLVVDGGKITNISGRAWSGIEVEGDETKAQLTPHATNTGAVAWQGLVRFKNGALITHAVTGVKNWSGSVASAGGVIFVQNSNFIDNKVDVEFSNNSNNYTSFSWLYDSQFKTLGAIGDNLTPQRHIYMYRSNGVKIFGCRFEYAAGAMYTNFGMGLYTSDANYQVDQSTAGPCYFVNLERGINSQNTNNLKTATVNYAQFLNNKYIGAYFYNMNYITFFGNYVLLPVNTPAAGLYFNVCKYYNARNNMFTESGGLKQNTGIYALKSTTGLHQIYYNTFSKLKIGVNCADDNSGMTNITDGLKINCNDFTPIPNLYDVALTWSGVTGAPYPSVHYTQGTTTNANTLVRNRYAALCSNNANKWNVHPNSTKMIFHATNSNANTQPVPQPNCSSYNLIVQPTAISYLPTHCNPTPPNTGGIPTTAREVSKSNLDNYLTSLRSTDVEGSNLNEIQATMASKIGWFLADTLDHSDSLQAILDANESQMTDSDIQSIMLAIGNGDYTGASAQIDLLPTSKAEWADLLNKIVEVQQEPDGIFSLNTNSENKDFFIAYADNYSKQGNGIAQTILEVACERPYTIYMPQPEENMGRSSTLTGLANMAGDDAEIKLFPNPANSGVNVNFNFETTKTLTIEVLDLLGHSIYMSETTGSQASYIPLENVKSGMYLVKMTEGKKLLYTTKLVVEK
jgi:hypothetical protein